MDLKLKYIDYVIALLLLIYNQDQHVENSKVIPFTREHVCWRTILVNW